MVQPATYYLPMRMGEEGAVCSRYVLSGAYLTQVSLNAGMKKPLGGKEE